jgi:energy-coupling factor transporter transmembrane protein EcfT
MEREFTKDQEYFKAKKRVQKIKGFYSHLIVYCCVIPIIIFANLRFEPHFHWFWFSVLGWGTGLLIHWVTVFGFNLLGIGENWEERKIKEMMKEDKN